MAAAKKQGKALVAFVHIGGEVYGPGSEVPVDVAKRITNPAAWGGSSDSADDDSEGGEPDAVKYSDTKVPDLKAKIESRNEGREEGDLISLDGVKADLVAALEADDASE